jgi:hypothetical protein
LGGATSAPLEFADCGSGNVPAAFEGGRFIGNRTAGGRGASLCPDWHQAVSADRTNTAATTVAINRIGSDGPNCLRTDGHNFCAVVEMLLNVSFPELELPCGRISMMVQELETENRQLAGTAQPAQPLLSADSIKSLNSSTTEAGHAQRAVFPYLHFHDKT